MFSAFSFLLSFSCVFGANWREESNDNNAADQFPCVGAADYHMSMSGGAIEEKKMESVFSACNDILLEEINGFCGEDRFLNVDVETHQGDNASNLANALHHKRKSIVVVGDDDLDHNKLNNDPNKSIHASNNATMEYGEAESFSLLLVLEAFTFLVIF